MLGTIVLKEVLEIEILKRISNKDSLIFRMKRWGKAYKKQRQKLVLSKIGRGIMIKTLNTADWRVNSQGLRPRISWLYRPKGFYRRDTWNTCSKLK